MGKEREGMLGGKGKGRFQGIEFARTVAWCTIYAEKTDKSRGKTWTLSSGYDLARGGHKRCCTVGPAAFA